MTDETPMGDKDRFDALLKLAEFRMEVRKDRRQLEWRVSLGGLALPRGWDSRLRGLGREAENLGDGSLYISPTPYSRPRMVGVAELYEKRTRR